MQYFLVIQLQSNNLFFLVYKTITIKTSKTFNNIGKRNSRSNYTEPPSSFSSHNHNVLIEWYHFYEQFVRWDFKMFDLVKENGVSSYGGRELKWKRCRWDVSVLMENNLKEIKESVAVIDKDSKSTVTGGVGDVYGEESASEDQAITPWTFSVARFKNCFFFFVSNLC
ncbi:uncharacterized protein LOC124890424 [Capsicum annuum]|uniref:uncharacterized protein LOC107860997 n=1 Tax=Capsicum annuum TaxID=4072 RepID=UPI001FB0D2BD|nr:uncharacterized protein LOC107860997 [Capsicum annuum]XP_047258209.1 uncharacterized protein LOC124890410 [Capsicum annuum]XP_047258225.1 uncharacterized protein LOC124890424 [Capsicum annuum]